MNSVETIRIFLDNNAVDMDLILSEDTAIELVKDLLKDNCQFIQSVERIKSIFDEIEVTEDGVASVSRLITADGDSVYFVFPVDEHKIENEHLVVEKEIMGYLDVDSLNHIKNKYILYNLEKRDPIKEFIKSLF